MESAVQQLALFPEARPWCTVGVECSGVIDDTGSTKHQGSPKSLGAYYTDSQVADFLVWWAVRNATDTVLDPSFGGGVFLRSACKRLRELTGNVATQVFGIELDREVHSRIAEKLHDEFGVVKANLVQSDFFEAGPDRLPPADVAVGNPPFIRYQRFTGEVRRRALIRAAEQGLKLSKLSSSWLPFLIYSIRFLRPGGRLAMVIPFEIGHASYALPVLRHLSRVFQSVTFLTFRKKLFPDLSEDTLLLLAEGKDPATSGQFYLRDLPHAGVLADIQAAGRRPLAGLLRLDRERLASGHQRIIEYLLPRRARELYRELRGQDDTVPLGTLADVGIGYVTGANEFFHLDPLAVAEWGIPSRFLRACVRRGRALAGLRFTQEDWQGALAHGQAGYLLELPAEGDLPDSILRYLAHGQKLGVHRTFKCRTRTPWYRVPHVHHPDAFLTYMSGDVPRLVANDAGVVAPNSLHILRLHPHTPVTRDAITALWQTSLARLSAEVEGHALGGGMLKLESGEAEQVILPFPRNRKQLDNLAAELDATARRQGDTACAQTADRQLLQKGLGLSVADCNLLRDAAEVLRTRRMARA